MVRLAFLAAVCLLTAGLLLGVANSQQDLPQFKLSNEACQQPVVRKELRNLTSDERRRFLDALNEMHSRGWFDAFARLHDTAAHGIHGNDLFLVWHRAFIRHFEVALQAIDPGLTLPYWNWGIDANNPESTEILGPNWLGGNGRGSNYCVRDGVVANWGRNYPDRSCLRRQYRYGSTTGSFWPTGALNRIITQSGTYTELREAIENGSHGVVHLGIGGDLRTMWAPVDMIDRLYMQWQMDSPQHRRFEVEGQDIDGNSISLDTRLPYYGTTVREAVDALSAGYCYTYDDISIASISASPENSSKSNNNTAANSGGSNARQAMEVARVPDSRNANNLAQDSRAAISSFRASRGRVESSAGSRSSARNRAATTRSRRPGAVTSRFGRRMRAFGRRDEASVSEQSDAEEEAQSGSDAAAAAAATAEDSSSASASEASLASVSSSVDPEGRSVDLDAVPPMPDEWIESQHLNPQAATRLHRLVNDYIKQNGSN